MAMPRSRPCWSVWSCPSATSPNSVAATRRSTRSLSTPPTNTRSVMGKRCHRGVPAVTEGAAVVSLVMTYCRWCAVVVCLRLPSFDGYTTFTKPVKHFISELFYFISTTPATTMFWTHTSDFICIGDFRKQTQAVHSHCLLLARSSSVLTFWHGHIWKEFWNVHLLMKEFNHSKATLYNWQGVKIQFLTNYLIKYFFIPLKEKQGCHTWITNKGIKSTRVTDPLLMQ